MIRYLIVSIASGLLFGTMDSLINANPLAQRLFAAFKPVARTTVNVPAGIFLFLYKSRARGRAPLYARRRVR
jgi:hypothetical protein